MWNEIMGYYYHILYYLLHKIFIIWEKRHFIFSYTLDTLGLSELICNNTLPQQIQRWVYQPVGLWKYLYKLCHGVPGISLALHYYISSIIMCCLIYNYHGEKIFCMCSQINGESEVPT